MASRRDVVRAMPARRSGSDKAPRQPLEILVAEDNPANQKVVCAMLACLGYDPDVVSDGDEAIASVLHGEYDVVFMDVQMPRVSGVDAAREIRAALDDGVRPWIVALTATATEEDERRCFEAGMDEYVTKPVTLDTLIDQLDRSRTVRHTERRRAAGN